MTTMDQAGATLEFPLADYPAVGRFALDFVEGSSRATRFCPPVDWDEIAPRPPSRSRASVAAGLRRSNRAWGNDAEILIGAWESGRAVAVIAGQQVGFGGGPLYTLAKIASLVSIRRRLQRRGIDAVPFFWLATEDHDWDEVTTLLLQRDDVLTRIRATERPNGRFPVGRLPVPPSLREAIAAWCGRLPEWAREGTTFGDAFAALLVEAIGSGEVVLVDSLLPELRAAGADLFASIAASLGEIDATLETRSAELRAAGYEPQVARSPDGGWPLLYAISSSGERETVAADDLAARIRQQPETISTGVLARPLLQDLIFDPAVFVGGPSEVAYYAQVAPLHARFGVTAPAVALRGHALVAPARRLRALDRYGFDLLEMFGPLDRALEAREEPALERVEKVVRDAEAALETAAARINEIALGADRGLDRSMRRSRRRLAYHLARTHDRARRAVARRDAERWTALSRLQQIVAPDGVAQDRVAAWLGWYTMWGRALFDRLVDEVEPDEPVVRVIGF
ncbi:MAG: bacillithiol biosynthesis protein BshC [Thermoanaerobaculia bacterium]